MTRIPRNPTEPLYPLYIPEARGFVSITNSPEAAPLTPNDIYLAYNLERTNDAGKGINIAVIEAFDSPAVKEDLAYFSSFYGLPSPIIETYYLDGRTTVQNSRWRTETCADTQWLFAVAPSAKILCVFAPDSRITSLFSAVEYAVSLGADIISMSWGSSEFAGQQRYSEYMLNTEKIFVASAGDTGGAVFFPSSSDAVVSVGGTVLYRQPNGETFERTAWANGGGGPSRFTKIPEWQKIFEGIPTLSGEYRATPDTALDASENPGYSIYDSLGGGFKTVGGTSISAAIFAGIIARLLQKNGRNLKFPQYLYELAGKTEYKIPQTAFYDIVIGSNGKYSAKTGYDLCTGLGEFRYYIN